MMMMMMTKKKNKNNSSSICHRETKFHDGRQESIIHRTT